MSEEMIRLSEEARQEVDKVNSLIEDPPPDAGNYIAPHFQTMKTGIEPPTKRSGPGKSLSGQLAKEEN
jgi:hypothetical protein